MAAKLAIVMLLGLCCWPPAPASGQNPELQLLCPVDGLILTPRCDVSPAPGIQAGLVGLAPAGFEVRVNGQQVRPIAGDLPALGVTWRQEGQYWRLTHALGQLLVDPARYTPFYYLLPLQTPLTEVEVTARHGTAP